jgi:lysophospholipase L1-like esterase
MVIRCAFDGDVDVRNFAQGGRSSKSFISEGFFAQIEQQIHSGDTLLIQFGHNDQKPDAARHTDPDTDYKSSLTRYLDMARAHGAQPVLITPVTRRRFENGKLVDTHAAYARAVRELAADTKTPLIDLTADSMQWVSALGDVPSKRYFVTVDNTHFNELGARHVAALIAQRLVTLDVPISKRVLGSRPALTRDTPLGDAGCGH